MSRSQRLETAAIRKRAAGVNPKTKQIEGKKIKFEIDKDFEKRTMLIQNVTLHLHMSFVRPIWPECQSGNLTFFSIRSKSSNRFARLV